MPFLGIILGLFDKTAERYIFLLIQYSWIISSVILYGVSSVLDWIGSAQDCIVSNVNTSLFGVSVSYVQIHYGPMILSVLADSEKISWKN